MSDQANPQESLAEWSGRNGIDLGDECERIVGYWCRVSGVPLHEESIRRDYGNRQIKMAQEAWREADEEIRDEAAEASPASLPTDASHE